MHPIGTVIQVKVLGIMAMLDEGEYCLCIVLHIYVVYAYVIAISICKHMTHG